MIKLSIVTINLNNLDGLVCTLLSIFEQDFDAWELVVVDGGSKDGSLDVLEKYNDKIYKCLVGQDSGIYNAMNIGIKCARGEYIHVLNSGDTYYHPKSLSSIDFRSANTFLCFGVKKYSPKKYVWFPRVIKSECFVDLAHPGLIVRSDYYVKKLYDERFSVVSDSLFIFENVIPCESFLSDEILVEMQPEGISTQVSFNHEMEKQSLFWKYGYRPKSRFSLSIKSFLVFLKRFFLKLF